MYEQLMQKVRELGAAHVGLVKVSEVAFEPSFRKLCEQNACGVYGRCWMCPPLVGEVAELIARAKSYQSAIVYQTISALEDSYDFEGMMDAAKKMNALSQRVRKLFESEGMNNCLFLGAGACLLCERCAKMDEEPCRFPEIALPSLEAYGIDVSTLAPQAGMKYINGVNTVTYFGGILIGADE